MRRLVGTDLGLEHEPALWPWGVADEVKRLNRRHRLLMIVALATAFMTGKRLPVLQA